MPNYSNLEQEIEQILFNYGGVLQKIAEIQKEVYEQIEALKNAGVKIRRANKTYSSGTVLTCIGSGNGSKFLFTQNGGTTGEDFKDESWYNSLVVGQTYIDGGVTWEVLEDAYTKHSIVESALNASHASSADVADYANSALQAAYVGPFQVVNLGTATSSGSESSGGPIVTSTGINYEVIDPTRTSLPPNAGVIVNGEKNIPVPYSSGFLPDGQTLYLWGSSSGENLGFAIGWHINAETQKNEFLTALAHNSGGKVQQIQFGDIVTPWPGEDQEIYGGPFKVEPNGEITQDNTVPIKITDPTSPINQTTGKHEWAGKIFAGENYYTVNTVSGNLNNGDYIYLMGDSKNNSVEFHYVAYEPQITSDGEPTGGQRTITSAGFYVRLAKNEGGKIIQIQHGDITVPPWKVTSADSATLATEAEHALTADYASSANYNGPFKVSVTETTEGTNTVTVKVTDPQDLSFPQHAGRVFNGSAISYVISSSIQVTDGGFVYLNGTSGSTPEISNAEGNNNTSQFSIRLAKNEGGKIVQMQYGDVYSIPWNAKRADSATQANYANVASSALYAEYNGPFHVSGTYTSTLQAFTSVSVKDDTRTGNIGGYMVLGSVMSSVESATGITLSSGYKLYLKASKTSSGYEFSYISGNTQPAPGTDEFITQLAYNTGGQLIQTQFGDIVQPSTGVTKISVTGGIVNPSSGTGDVNIIIPPPGAGNILPVNWNVMAGTYLYPTHITGQGKYTTDPDYNDTDPDAEYLKLGEGYGGIIVGWIVAPLDAGLYSEPEYVYILHIEQDSLNSVDIPLLVPESTKVVTSIPTYSLEQDPDTGEYTLETDSSETTGTCWTPRKSYVYLVIPPNTYFTLEENGAGNHGSYLLTFYPYIQPS